MEEMSHVSQVSNVAILIPMISEFKNCHQPKLVAYSICVCNFCYHTFL